jgi:predicted DNA binding protein
MATEITHAAQTAEDDTAHRQPTATLITGRLPTEAFALEDTLSTVPDLSVSCASLVTAGETASLPLLWFQTDAPDTLDTALASDPTVAAADPLVHTDNRHLYRMEWTPDIRSLCRILLTTQAILVDAYANETHWTVEILHPDRENIRHTSEFCEQYNVSFEIDSLRSLDPDQTTQYGLTAAQYEALTVACQRGYFKVPREVDLEAVATELGISHQAASERLRRGHQTLITTALGGAGPTLADSPAAEQSLDSDR